MQRLFPFTHNDEINIGNPVHPIFRVVGHFRPAQQNFHVRHNLFQIINDLDRLFNVPDVTREPNHISTALVQIRHNIHHRVLNRILR
ncbi:hypothetical protein D3C76_1621440 [compost metagenome]